MTAQQILGLIVIAFVAAVSGCLGYTIGRLHQIAKSKGESK